MRKFLAKLISTIAIMAISEAINIGRESAFKETIFKEGDKGIGAYMWSAILDHRTCPICKELDGCYFKANDPVLEAIKPPIHPGCRCILVGVMQQELDAFPVDFTYLNSSQVDYLTRNKL